MTVVLMEGWDLQTLNRGWILGNSSGFGNNNNSAWVAPRIAGSAHGAAWRLASDSGFGDNHAYLGKPFPGTYTEAIFGFGFNLDEGAYSVYDLRGTYRGEWVAAIYALDGTFLAGIAADGSNHIILIGYAAGTTWDTGFVATPGAWNYYEIRVKVNGASGEIELHINGGDSGLGTVTNSNGSSGAHLVYIHTYTDGGGSSADPEYSVTTDDLYVVDCTSGSAPTNTFLGDSIIETIVPEADGAETDFTPSAGTNWQNVDEIPADSDTTYNASSNVGDTDTFDLEDLAAAPAVYAVQTNLFAKKDTAGTREIAPVVREGGSDYAGATVTLSTSYVYYSEIMEEDPATSAPWNVTDINADEFGVKVVT